MLAHLKTCLWLWLFSMPYLFHSALLSELAGSNPWMVFSWKARNIFFNCCIKPVVLVFLFRIWEGNALGPRCKVKLNISLTFMQLLKYRCDPIRHYMKIWLWTERKPCSDESLLNIHLWTPSVSWKNGLWCYPEFHQGCFLLKQEKKFCFTQFQAKKS